MRYSIWLTALIVIALIILLALTVYYVRERAIIDLFSSQQASLAYQSASRIEESIAGCEKDLSMLPKLLPAFAVDEAKKREEIKALSDELKDIGVLAVLEIDKDDVVVYGYPENLSSKLYGKKIEDAFPDHVLKKMNQRFTGEISGVNVNGSKKPGISE